MKLLLYFSALLFAVLAVMHSYLGERFVLMRIFRVSTLPKLSGSTLYMQRILRLAWHVTSVAWLGLASLVFMLADPPLDTRAVSAAVGITALVSFVIVLVGSRGKHVAAWLMFLIICAITLYHASI